MRAAVTALLLWALAIPVSFAGQSAIGGTIDVSSAPWDGAAYALILSLEPLDPPKSVLRIDLWGHPASAGPLTVKFTGHEDPGGGPGRGEGRVSFQEILNKSSPVPLSGRVVFDRLEEGKPVTGHYELNTLDQSRGFKGFFRLRWGSATGRADRSR
jgi:hypothetical protein